MASMSPTANLPLSDPEERVYPLAKYQKIFPEAVRPAPVYLGTKFSTVVFTMLPGQVHEPHKHDDQTQIWVILEGQGEFLMGNGRSELVGPGTVCVHHPNQMHGIKTVGDQNLVYINISEKVAPKT
jgi:quercetin dioxygenase-like cupin family protein